MMKKKLVCMKLGLAAILVMGLSIPAAAAETEAAAVSTEAAAETEAGDKRETQTVVITFAVNGSEIAIINEADLVIHSAKTEAAEDKASDRDAQEQGTCRIILDAEDGQHEFENVVPEKWTESRLIEDHGFLYIRYKLIDGSSRDASETKDAVIPDKELTMWALTSVNVREEADADSAVLKVAEIGEECKVIEIWPGWYQVEYSGVTGYINHKFLSDDREAVDAAIDAAKAAEAAQAAVKAQSESYSYDYSDYSYNSGSYDSGSSGDTSDGGSSGNGSSDGGDSGQGCLVNGLLN